MPFGLEIMFVIVIFYKDLVLLDPFEESHNKLKKFFFVVLKNS